MNDGDVNVNDNSFNIEINIKQSALINYHNFNLKLYVNMLIIIYVLDFRRIAMFTVFYLFVSFVMKN